jgi:hypothetical protein
MVEQFGEILTLRVFDDDKKAEIDYNAIAGDPPLGFVTLKFPRGNDTAFNAMVTLATFGLSIAAPGGQHVHVKYDSNKKIDEMLVHF